MRTVVVLGAVLIVVACSSGSDSGGGTPCEIAGEKICNKACGCGTGGKCITGYRPRTSAVIGVTELTWSDSGDCKAAYAGSACRDKDAPLVDWTACQAAVDADSCNAEGVFVIPAACDPPKEGGT